MHVRQSTAGSAGNLSAVADGSMDIALTASTANPQTGHPARGIVLHPLVSEALVFACRPDHPLSGRPDVSVADLADETILRFPPGWGIRETVDRVFGDAPGLRAVPLADPRLRWNLSAAITASRRPTAATNALLRALTQASSQAARRRRRL